MTYPIFKVILGFGLCGGAIGGLLAWVIDAIISHHYFLFSATDMLWLLFLLGSLYGFVPALLTGIILARTKTIIKNHKDYIKPFIIGAIFSAITAMILGVANQLLKDIYDIQYLLYITVHYRSKKPTQNLLIGKFSVFFLFQRCLLLLLNKRLTSTPQADTVELTANYFL